MQSAGKFLNMAKRAFSGCPGHRNSSVEMVKRDSETMGKKNTSNDSNDKLTMES